MKLNELTGYKQNDLYTGAKSTFMDKSRYYLKRMQNLGKFSDLMDKYGFERLGGGVFGVTYEKRGYPWVFKVFNDDPAYLSYLKYAIRHQSNPNVPKIKGKMLRISDTAYAVRMEKLAHYTETDPDSDIATLAWILRGISYFNDLKEDKQEWLQETYPGIYSILKDLDTSSSFRFDIHGNNFMMRGNTPVITDPMIDIAAMNESSEQDGVINELVGYRKHPAYDAAKTSLAPTQGFRPVSSKLKEFTEKLKDLGYDIDVKGLGRRGTVFKRPNDPYVIKVFQNDPEYLMYLKYVLSHQDNPHVPKVRGKPVKIAPDTYAIRMEQLNPITNPIGDDYDVIESLLKTMTWGRFKANKFLKLEEPLLYKMLTDLAHVYGDNGSTDFVIANIMRRDDGTIVITDPA